MACNIPSDPSSGIGQCLKLAGIGGEDEFCQKEGQEIEEGEGKEEREEGDEELGCGDGWDCCMSSAKLTGG